MMKSISPLVESPGRAAPGHGAAHLDGPFSYESVLSIQSQVIRGVTFVIHRVSFGRRMELTRRVRELSQRAEFLAAGSEIQEKIEANILALEIDAMYLRWGLVSVEGLIIDEEAATIDHLLEKGPEELTQEVLAAIRKECGLSDAERKN